LFAGRQLKIQLSKFLHSIEGMNVLFLPVSSTGSSESHHQTSLAVAKEREPVPGHEVHGFLSVPVVDVRGGRKIADTKFVRTIKVSDIPKHGVMPLPKLLSHGLAVVEESSLRCGPLAVHCHLGKLRVVLFVTQQSELSRGCLYFLAPQPKIDGHL
jgi:hypothetical protein